MDLAEKLTVLRTEAGLSQTTLAEQVEVARQTVSRWETGEVVPTPDNLRRLSKLYNVPVSYLTNDQPSAVVAVMEKPEKEKAADTRWRKPALMGVVIGLAIAAIIALLIGSYFVGYQRGVEDATPSYPVYEDVVDEADIEEPGVLFGW